MLTVAGTLYRIGRMKLLGILVAAFSLVAGFSAFHLDHSSLYLLAAFGFGAAFTTYRSERMGTYLTIFAAIFSVETILFGAATLIDAYGYWPVFFGPFKMELSVAATVALFSMLVYAASFVPIVKKMMAIADRYFHVVEPTRARIWPLPSFRAKERTVAVSMVVFLVVLNQVEVLLSILISYAQRDFFNALQQYNVGAFWYALLVSFSGAAFLYVGALVIEYVVSSTLVMRWRRWLTHWYISRWLDDHRHYRMGLVGAQTDNPDQRISEDIVRFIDPSADQGGGGVGVYSFTITLISTLSSLVSFSILLWSLSRGFAFPGTSVVIPGFLFWCALIYAIIGTVTIHMIGWPLSKLAFTRQRFEADFRFSLARLREYGEQVALLSGENTEQVTLRQRFAAIVKNYFEIVALRKKMQAFSYTFNQITVVIPYAVAAPFYFSKKIALGVLSQTARAFGEVNSSLTIFVNYYTSLAEFRAVLERLSTFDASIERADAQPIMPRREAVPATDGRLALSNVTVRLPDGRDILSNVDLSFAAKEAVLMMGPSGSGKSTLFRAIAGIWPYADGVIKLPSDAKLMVLPQKPYLPIGTLRGALSYPEGVDTYDRDRLVSVLRDVKLEGLVDSLDVEDNWGQRLSGGEQQRLAIGRALLKKPDYLLLDEATSAMDIELEKSIYAVIWKGLPDTTVISNAHRKSLLDQHERTIRMTEVGDGRFTPRDAELVAAQ